MMDKIKKLFLGSKDRLFFLLGILFILLTVGIVYEIVLTDLPDSAVLDEFEEEMITQTELDEEIEVEEREFDVLETEEYEAIRMDHNPFASLLEEQVIVEDAGMSRAEEEEAARQREREIEDDIRNSYDVTGLVEQTHSTIAMVQRRSDGMTYMLREGETVDDVEVQTIRGDRVRLAREGVGVVYDLGEEDD